VIFIVCHAHDLQSGSASHKKVETREEVAERIAQSIALHAIRFVCLSLQAVGRPLSLLFLDVEVLAEPKLLILAAPQ
jgi:hypothetical protein